VDIDLVEELKGVGIFALAEKFVEVEMLDELLAEKFGSHCLELLELEFHTGFP